jgi:hypothetical protein
MRKIMLAACIGATLFQAACATAPDRVQASYVSPMEYSNHSCDQIREELVRVSDRVRMVAGQQSQDHTRDAVAMTVGLVIFWPALFFMSGKGHQEELADLKGRYDALDRAALDNNCSVSQEMHPGAAAPASNTQPAPYLRGGETTRF